MGRKAMEISMRKYGKLAVTLLLCLAVISSLIPMAFARTWSDVETFEQEIDMLTGLGFMDGENSKQFFPGDYVENDELIRILMNVRNVTEGDNVRRFQDIPNTHYAFKEINAAFKLGYVKVPENKMFYPDEKATADKALEIMLKMLNYDTYMNVSDETLRQVANRAGLLDGLQLGEYITKGELAKLIYNSFTSGMLEGSGVVGVNAAYKVNKEKTTLSFHNWELITGNITGNERTALYYTAEPEAAGKVRIDTKTYFEGESFAGDLLGYEVDAVVTKEKTGSPTIIYAAANRKGNVLTVKAEDIDNVKNMTFNYQDRKHLSLRNDMLLIYNGMAVKFDQAVLDIEYGEVTFISTTGGRKYDIVLVNEYESFVISNVAAAEKKIYVKRGKFKEKAYIDYESNIYQDVRIFKNGERATEADLVAGSAIAVYYVDADRDVLTIDVGTTNVEGKISTSGISEDTGRKMLMLGEEEYLIAPNVFGDQYITLGEGVALTLDFAGYIVEVKKAVVDSNYGVVTWIGYDDVKETAMVKMFKLDGKFTTFNTVSDDFKLVTGKTVTRIPAGEIKTNLSGIIKSEIVMYGTNADGLLNKIVFPEAHDFKNELNNVGKFTLYKEYKDAVQADTSNCQGIGYSNTKTIVIPPDDQYTDDGCKVLGNPGFDVDHGPKDANKNFKFYNVGLNGAAELCLYRKGVNASIADWESPVKLVVQKVIDTINKDDEQIKAVVGFSGGAKVTVPIGKEAVNSGTPTPIVADINKRDINNATFGDILTYALDADGAISAYSFVYSDGVTKNAMGVICNGGNGYGTGRTWTWLHGNAKYYQDGIMSIEFTGDSLRAVPMAETVPVYKLNRKDKTFEAATLGDVVYKNFYANIKGSELVVHTSRGGGSEVFIYED